MIQYTVPLPPSTNNLYFTRKKGGRAKSCQYKSWLIEAGWKLKEQGLLSTATAQFGVNLLYEIDKRSRCDLGNHEKPLTDLLVKMGVLKDDSQQYVNEITLRWAMVDGCRITLEAV